VAQPRLADFFSFLGLPRKLRIDMADLEQRYRALSRQFHPDYFYNAPPAERRGALERSSYLNDAYRTLKSPISRIEYLLKLEGLGSGPVEREGRPVERKGGPVEREGFSRAAVPPQGLLEEVFALNEELDEVREQRASGAPAETWRARLDRARQPIEAKRAEHESQLQELSERWDAVADNETANGDRRTVLEALRDRILERNYINNLLAGIEKELSA
jgi:molecular chaperone HscB